MSHIPTLEEFGLDDSIYEDLKDQTERFREVQSENKKTLSIEDNWFVGMFFVVLLLVGWIGLPIWIASNTTAAIPKDSWLSPLFIGLYVLWICGGGIWFLTWLNDTFKIDAFFYNLFTLGKYSKSKEKDREISQEIENLNKSTKERVAPFEKAFYDYNQEQIDNFYATKLYRKHSGTVEFEESLGEFGLMLETLASANAMLLTSKFGLWEYQDYFNKRKTDHTTQQAKIKNEEFSPVVDFVRRVSQPRARRVVAPEETYRTPRKINWESINKSRAKTGLKGEEIVVKIEREFFRSISRDDLADKVRHVSKEDGDGSGYDVLSFFSDGNEKYIEVKSTNGTLESSFYISRNELGFLQEHQKDAFVYRVQLSHESDDVYLKAHTSVEVLQANEIIPVQYLVKL